MFQTKKTRCYVHRFNGLFSFTSTGPLALTHCHEWSAPCPPPPAQTLPSPVATTVKERDGPDARPTIATVDGIGMRLA